MSKTKTFTVKKFEECIKNAAIHYANNPSNNDGLRKEGTIYIVKVNYFVKIGFTLGDDVMSRLNNIQTSCPYKVNLMHKDKANLCAEQAIHYAFKNRRVTGEWYRHSYEIRILVDTIISNGLIKVLKHYAEDTFELQSDNLTRLKYR